jgi:hypothetical protein
MYERIDGMVGCVSIPRLMEITKSENSRSSIKPKFFDSATGAATVAAGATAGVATLAGVAAFDGAISIEAGLEADEKRNGVEQEWIAYARHNWD